MTIHEGMCEAFRRMGASENGIKAAMAKNDAAFPLIGKDVKQTQIPAGYEEDFVSAYIKLTTLISEEGPVRDYVAQYLEGRVANN